MTGDPPHRFCRASHAQPGPSNPRHGGVDHRHSHHVDLPEERLTAAFGPNWVLDLTPDLVGPWITKNRGIIGEGVELTLAHIATCGLRRSCFISLGGCCSRSSAIRARTRGSTSSSN